MDAQSGILESVPLESVSKVENHLFWSGALKKDNQKSLNARSGLVFPVKRIQKKMKERHRTLRKPGHSTAIKIAAALEYLCSEVLDIAAQVARANKRKRITDDHILLAIKSDMELRRLMMGVILSDGKSKVLKKKKATSKSQKKPPKKPTKTESTLVVSD